MRYEIVFDGKIINELLNAVSNEEGRPYLRGVHIYDEGNDRIYEATNGHILLREVTARLGAPLSEIDSETKSGQEGGIVIRPEKKFRTTKINSCVCLAGTNFEHKKDSISSATFSDNRGEVMAQIWKEYVPTERIIEDSKQYAETVDYWAPIQPRYAQIVQDFFNLWIALPAPTQNKIAGEFVKNNALVWEVNNKLALVMPVR